MDFGALPPEVNSGRMYVGAGSGPLLAAAAAWDELGAELYSYAAAYSSTIAGMTVGSWLGPAATSMSAAVAPYLAWATASAAKAEQAAMQTRLAAAAYETAFAATVPPPVIAANRGLLMTLVATNILGQNTAAIAAAEAEYAEMWAQDAAAMYAYSASSAAATQLASFTEPPQTVDPSGAASQSAAMAHSAASDIQSGLSALINVTPTMLQGLAATPSAAAATPAASIIEAIYPITAALRPFFAAVTGAYSPIGAIIVPGGWWLFSLQALGLSQNAPGVAELLGGGKDITGGAVAAGAAAGRLRLRGDTRRNGSERVDGPRDPGRIALGSASLGHLRPGDEDSGIDTSGHNLGGDPGDPGDPRNAAGGPIRRDGHGESGLAGRALAGAGVRTVGNGTTGAPLADGFGTTDTVATTATTATIIVVPAD